MELSTWLLFSGVALLAILSPGPAVLLAITTSLAHGFGKAVFSSVGNVVGILVISSAAILGLGIVLQTSALLFGVLKTAGAFYLIYLGLKQWRSKRSLFSEQSEEGSQSSNKAFRQGLLVALTNPKAVLFFTALFPQFLDIGKPVALQFFVLTVTFMILSLLTLLGYALTAQTTKTWLAKGQRPIWFNRISGTVFIGFGLGMLRLRGRAA